MRYLFFFWLLPFWAWAQVPGSLSGRVRDAQGQPAPFASVVLPATRQGTTADAEGRFQLAGVAPGLVLVRASAVGYEPAEQTTNVAANRENTVLLVLKAAGKNLDEVVITGVSRATEVRRSPVPIATLNQREIRINASANAIDAAVRGIPGMSAVTTGPNISKPFIRGLGYNRVLTMFNGLRQEGQQWGDEHGIEVDGYGLDRVEVVKGPASLLYGSDAVAGVVNLLPAQPNGPVGELHGEALSEYQSVNGLLGASLGLNYRSKTGWLTSFRASQRLARDYRTPVDGLVYNTGFQELQLAGMAGVRKQWGGVQLYLTSFDDRQEIADGSRDSLSRAFTRQVAEGGRDDIRNRPLVPADELRSYTIGDLHQRIQHYRAFATADAKVGIGELRVLLGVQQNHRREFNHPTAPAQPGLALTLTTANYQASYLLPAFQGFELTVGANGMSQANRHRNATDFPIPAYDLFDLGGFGVLKKRIGALEITGGLRYDTRAVRWADFHIASNPATGFDAAATAATPGASLPFPAFAPDYRGWSASLGGSYAVGEHLVLRANVARGYRAPNIPEIGSNGLDPGAHIVYLGNRSFQPEFSLQEDVGILWKSASVEATAEAFFNRVDNFIYQARLYDDRGQPVEIVPGNATYQFEQAAANLYGGELALNLHPPGLPWLSWRSGAALVIGLNDNPVLRERSGAAGRYLPLIPAPQARTELRLTAPSRPSGRFSASYLRLTLEGTAPQNRFYAVDGAETATPGYLLLGAGVGTTLRTKAGREALQLFLQVDNVFDTAYQAHLNRLKYFEYYTASGSGRLGIYSPGRNVGVKVVVPF